MHAIGLFDAKTQSSQYVGRAKAGEEPSIMRQTNPLPKLSP